MYENYLTAALVIYAIDRLVNWYHLHALRALADEAMFPADDPIMTSSIEAFEYEDEEEEAIPPNWEYDAPEVEEPPVATPAFDYAEEEVEVKQKLGWQANTDADPEHLAKETARVPLEGVMDGDLYARCQALTKSGTQCKNTPTYPHNKYCYTHQGVKGTFMVRA